MKTLFSRSFMKAIFAMIALVCISLGLTFCSKDKTSELCKVTVVSNGGTNFAPIYVAKGDRIPLKKLYPAPITNDGGEFIHWCSDESLKTEFDFNTPIESDMTIYAKWRYEEYVVTYVMNGAPEREAETYRVGNYIPYVRPEWTNKVFAGWYSDAAFGSPFDFTMTPVKTDITIYAKWVDPSPSGWFTIDTNGVMTGCWVPSGTNTVVIPEGVKEIGAWFILANGGDLLNVKEFIFPQSLTTINTGAFKSSAITSVMIPPLVKSLSSFTFQDCASLKSFVFEPGSTFESVVVNGNLEPVFGTPQLSNIIFPPSFTDLDGYSFAPSCTALQSVYFQRAESAVKFHIKGGGSLWLFGGYYPGSIYVPNDAKSLYMAALREGCANDYDYEKMSGILVGF